MWLEVYDSTAHFVDLKLLIAIEVDSIKDIFFWIFIVKVEMFIVRADRWRAEKLLSHAETSEAKPPNDEDTKSCV